MSVSAFGKVIDREDLRLGKLLENKQLSAAQSHFPFGLPAGKAKT